jgi:transposase
MKVEVITDARGTPVAVVVEAANAAETDLCAVAIDHLPLTLPVPPNTPLIYDRAADSDPLRDRLAKRNLRLVAPHRKNRRKPSRNDGRTLRKYKRRYVVERTFAWFHHYRRAAVRYDLKPAHYEGFVGLACILMVLTKVVV